MNLFNKNNNKPLFSTYSEFVEQYLDALYKTAFRFTGGQAEAEDVVQNLVIKLQPRFRELQNLKKPLTWLNKVLYRMFIDYRRQVSRSPIKSISELNLDDEDTNYFDTLLGVDESPQSIIEKAELAVQLQHALNQLSDDDRSLIVLYEVEGNSISDLHEITDMPKGTIKSKLYRARIQLRNIIKNETNVEDISCHIVRT